MYAATKNDYSQFFLVRMFGSADCNTFININATKKKKTTLFSVQIF